MINPTQGLPILTQCPQCPFPGIKIDLPKSLMAYIKCLAFCKLSAAYKKARKSNALPSDKESTESYSDIMQILELSEKGI